MALFVGTLGATLAGPPLRIAVDAFGWRAVMLASSAVTAIVAVSIWVVVRDDPSERGYQSYYPREERERAVGSVSVQLREVLRYRNSWLLFFIPGAFSGLVLMFAGLWGVPFLVSQHGFSPREAATMASAMLIGWSLGGLVFGPLSDRMQRRKLPMAAGLVLMLCSWALVALSPGLFRPLLIAALLAVAFCAGAFILTFAFAKESVPARLGGTISGIANMGVMCGGMVMQPLVGYVLDRNWTGGLENGVRVYDFGAYRLGFTLVFVWGAISLVLLAFARETRCRQAR
jgi:predicted MFS family arabinose efflux permease